MFIFKEYLRSYRALKKHISSFQKAILSFYTLQLHKELFNIKTTIEFYIYKS